MVTLLVAYERMEVKRGLSAANPGRIWGLSFLRVKDYAALSEYRPLFKAKTASGPVDSS